MFLSIIIPTFNEEVNIELLIKYIQKNVNSTQYEIIVSDAESTDKTEDVAKKLDAIITVSEKKGRAAQMNFGTSIAKGDVYYFVHADNFPTPTFYYDIENAISNQYNCGSFRFRFDTNRFILKINSFFTRFNYLYFRGGDQTIFVTKELFEKVGRFNDEMLIMEDYDFLKRLFKIGKFKLVPKETIVSSRKYDKNSWLQVQLANLKIVKMYNKGASQNEMVEMYGKMLNYRKNAF